MYHPYEAVELANTKYSDNVAVMAIVRFINLDRESIKADRVSKPSDFLDVYVRGSLGEKGYGTLNRVETSLFAEHFRRIDGLRRLHERMETLIIVLQALGEEIDY